MGIQSSILSTKIQNEYNFSLFDHIWVDRSAVNLAKCKNVEKRAESTKTKESEENSEEKLFILLSAVEIKISISSMILNSIELPLCGFLKHLNNSGRIFNTKQIGHFSLSVIKNYRF